MSQTLTRPAPVTGGRAASTPVRTWPRAVDARRAAGAPRSELSLHGRPRALCGDARRQAPPARRPAPIGWAAAVLVGIGLAVVLWIVVIGGSIATESSAPPVRGTEVVHVRGGESLGALAQRVAPGQPLSSVVATIKELNHMGGVALTAGQPLLAPIYRR